MIDINNLRFSSDFNTWVSPLSKLLGYEDDGSADGGFYIVAVLTTFVGLSFGCAVAIAFLGADCCRAFKQRKHWIPADSLLLGALSLQLLILLNRPSLDFSFHDNTTTNPLFYTCKYLNVFHGEWILILVGRVSTCVLMGCLLPGVASPLSTNLRTDMAALFISFSLVAVNVVSHELFILPTASAIPGYVGYSYINYYDSNPSDTYKVLACPAIDPWNSIIMELTNAIILVCMVTLALLLGSAALASIGIHQIVSRKIPSLLSPFMSSRRLYPPNILWEKIEEQVIKSWIVVRTSNPQYIISRSFLSSSLALIITVCNGLLIVETARCSYKTKVFPSGDQVLPCSDSDCYYLNTPHEYLNKEFENRDFLINYNEGCVRPSLSIPLILHSMVIFIGSTVIYCRCVAAAVYYPRGRSWKLFRDREYWKIEDFWLTHLLDLIDSSKRQRWAIAEESYLTKVIVRLLRSVRLHKLLPLIVWLQIFLVFFSKGCWLLSDLLFSNIFFRKLVVDSAWQGLHSIYTENAAACETELERDPAYAKYKTAYVIMQGENSGGLWIANKTSIKELKKRIQQGEEEGNRCNELISFITDKSSTGFSGQRCLKPGQPLGLEVESELNVNQRSFKMTAVSIIVLIFELSAFIHNRGEPEDMSDKAIKACSQAWKIMNVVEYSESEEGLLTTAADELLQKLEKERKWFGYHLPMSDSADKSPETAKSAVKELFERGKEVANSYDSRGWEEVVAAYSLCRQCRKTMDEYEFNSVEEVVEGLEGELGDVTGSCIGMAAGVIAEDCMKWATDLEEERIWKAAKILGKVKTITEKIGMSLEATPRSAIAQSAVNNGKHCLKRYQKFPTMTR